MFDIGMTELLVIGIVALIVVGPKDLPGMFRTLGRFTGKMRGMAREFQRAMEDAADDTGMKDIGRDLKGMSNPKRYGLDKLNEAASSFEKWEPGKSASSRAADGKSASPTSSPKETGGKTPRGPETERLSEERRAKSEAYKKAAADRATARQASEGQAEAVRQGEPTKTTGTAANTVGADPSRKPATYTASEDRET